MNTLRVLVNHHKSSAKHLHFSTAFSEPIKRFDLFKKLRVLYFIFKLMILVARYLSSVVWESASLLTAALRLG
jgi:hypothetical protein